MPGVIVERTRGEPPRPGRRRRCPIARPDRGAVLGRLDRHLALAALAHLATVWPAPRVIMRAVIAGVPADVPGGVCLPPMTDHTQRRIVMQSPDLLYAICTFDLREHALRVRAGPPSRLPRRQAGFRDPAGAVPKGLVIA
jgi:hypothetical protein